MLVTIFLAIGSVFVYRMGLLILFFLLLNSGLGERWGLAGCRHYYGHLGIGGR